MKHCIKDSVHSNESHSLFKNFLQKKKKHFTTENNITHRHCRRRYSAMKLRMFKTAIKHIQKYVSFSKCALSVHTTTLYNYVDSINHFYYMGKKSKLGL